MTITWYGHSCFKINNQGGRITIITDPFDKKIGLIPPRGNADVVTISHNHFDHNNIKAISGDVFAVEGPGEYEIKGIRIMGISSYHDKKEGQERGLNTIYVIKVDGIKICHLGDMGQEKLTDKQLESIGSVDVLMIPVDGVSTINAREAVKIVKQIDPIIVIPMHYKLPGLKMNFNDVKDFLKEIGLNGQQAVDKLILKKKDLIGKEMEVVIFKY